MWIIKHLSDPGLVFQLLTSRDYIVGRRDCDIPVPNDMSVSRKHAILSVTHAASDTSSVNKIPTLHIKDVSKLGTVLRGERITNKETGRIINNGDVLDFGTGGISKFSCVYEPFIVTTSCMDHASKNGLKQQMCKLGGHVIGDWTTSCCLVVMSSLSVTVKVICALVSLKPIVTPQYISDLIAAISGNTKLPDPNDYIPPLAESQVNPSDVSFKSDARRKTLFHNKRFIFLSASQYKKLHIAVELAGGITILIEAESISVDSETATTAAEHSLVADDTCVMMCDITPKLTDAQKIWIQRVNKLLARSGRRMITESEIGFAVLYCSLSKFCNPSTVHEVSSSANVLPMQTFSVPVVSQLSVSQHPPQVSQNLSVDERRSHNASNEPTISAPVQVKQEPDSQTMFVRPTTPCLKRTRVENSEVETGLQHRAKNARIESVGNLADGHGSANNVTVKTTGSHQHLDELSVEYSASVKVESTFVADSLPMLAVTTTTTTDRRFSSENSELICGGTDSVGDDVKVKKQHKKCLGSAAMAVSDEGSSTVVCGTVVSLPSIVASLVVAKSNDDVMGESGGGRTIDVSRSRICDEDVICCGQPEEVPSMDKRQLSESQSINKAQLDRTSKRDCSTEVDEGVPDGFLCARIPITIRRDPNYVKEENLPVSAVVTEDCSLIVQRCSNTQQKQGLTVDNSTANTTWKGQQVKNFKRFKKIYNFSLLPRIIGGSDLVVHSEFTPQQQEWFENGLQAEGALNSTDKLSQELFNWEPPKRRKL